MRRFRSKHHIDGLLILLLFGVFAASVLAVLLSGAGTYRRLSERDDRSYDRRTAAQYVSARVRQADRAGAVSVRTFEGCPALILSEEIGGESYETRIYHYDGYLRELFASAEGDFLPEDGEKVLPLEGFLVYPEEPGLQVRILTEDGRWQELRLALRSGEEGLHEK